MFHQIHHYTAGNSQIWDPVWYEGSALPDPSEVEESEIDSEINIEAMTTEQDVTDNDEYADSSESEYAQSCSEADSESDDEYQVSSVFTNHFLWERVSLQIILTFIS